MNEIRKLPIVSHFIVLTCPTNSPSNIITDKIIMAPISETIERRIDQGLDVEIPLSDNRKVIVSPNKVLTYGDVDFESKDDLALFERLNLKIDAFSGYNIPSGYDYETHSVHKVEGRFRWYQTWDNIKIIKMKYASLGKPKKIIVFKRNTL